MFQSTRPCGARRYFSGLPFLLYGFNPRARAGRDCWITFESSLMRVSIHAPVRGATLINEPKLSLDSFNPRARAGRDFFCKLQ